jgi:hypothetical protein
MFHADLHILAESKTDDENKSAVVDCTEAIASAVKELWVLCNQMSNFVAFEEEASQSQKRSSCHRPNLAIYH